MVTSSISLQDVSAVIRGVLSDQFDATIAFQQKIREDAEIRDQQFLSLLKDLQSGSREVSAVDLPAVQNSDLPSPTFEVDSTDEEEVLDLISPESYDRALLNTVIAMEQESTLPVTPPSGDSTVTIKMSDGPHKRDLTSTLDAVFNTDIGGETVAGRPVVTRHVTEGISTYVIKGVPPLPPRIKTRSSTKKKADVKVVCIFHLYFIIYSYHPSPGSLVALCHVFHFFTSCACNYFGFFMTTNVNFVYLLLLIKRCLHSLFPLSCVFLFCVSYV